MTRRGIATLAAALALTVALPLALTGRPAEAAPVALTTTTQAPMVLRYNAPAAESQWESRSLPVGNGAMGANVFGGVGTDVMTLNEKTLWSGGPGVSGYRYGNYPDDQVANRHDRLQWVRDQINANGQLSPSTVMSSSNLGQPKVGFGSYQSFGKLRLTVPETAGYTNYQRSLDLNTATAAVNYSVGGVDYTREVIASHPDNVIAMRVTASQGGKVSFTSRYDKGASGADLLANATVTASEGRITLKGTATDNGLRYNGQVLVVPTGGTITASGDSVTVTGADSVIVLWAGGTDYSPTYPAYRTGVDPQARIAGYVDAAAAKGWTKLVESHRADYQPLFDAMKLDLGGASLAGRFTDQVRAAYTGTGAQDRALETLYAQYGRYLLIASSREGSLPANLQGVWTNVNNPPWSADYHVNINLQMNYWPAWSTNLGTTHSSYLDYISSLIEPGRVSAKNVVGVDQGWMVMNETTPYGFTGVYDWATAAWFPEANAWLAQAFWWEYLYTGDDAFLRTKAWPVLKETSQFWAAFLQNDPRDNSLVANPSYSPEHGPFTAGTAMSQQIATELFTSTLEAADKLGINDAFVTGLKATLAKTDKGLKVQPDGLLAEWKTPGITGEPGHRHVSHLYALFPGRAISPETPETFAAAKASLNDRGDAGTGWSRAWKVNFWAHLRDGDRAHSLLTGLLRDSTLPNLWDTHPPFQIDGNFGGTSGITEMLVQNESGATAVLPALPSAWPSGSFDGVRAWGDTTVGASWTNGQVTQIRYATGKAGQRSVSGPIAAGGSVSVTEASSGASVAASVADGKVTFTAKAGTTYVLEPLVKLEVASSPASLSYQQQGDLVVTTSGVTPPAKLSLTLPAGWQAEPASAWAPAADGSTTFTLRAPNTGSSGTIGISLTGVGVNISRQVSIALVDPAVIPVTDTKAVAWDSQELTGESRPNGLARAALDGNPNTFWHTKWSGGSDQPPHFIVVDLGAVKTIEKVIYTPRPNGTTPRNGQVQNYRIEVASAGEIPVPTAAQAGDPSPGSTDGVRQVLPPDSVTFTSVATGSFPTNTTAPQTVTLDAPAQARYVKFVSTSNGVNGPWAHVGELAFAQASPTGSPELPGTTAKPIVQLSPDKAVAGASVSATVGGFVPGSSVAVQLGTGTPVTVTADASGFGRVQLSVPAGLPTGDVTVRASSGDLVATATLAVTAAPSPDPSPSVTPSVTPTPTPSVTPTPTPTPSVTPSASPSVQPGAPRVVVTPTTVGVGDQLTIRVTGFAPGERVQVELHSTPVTLGTITVDAQGSGTLVTRVPSVPAGAHTVVVKGLSSGVEASQAVTISSKPALPTTGAEQAFVLVLAALGLGVAVVALSARRRSRTS